MVEGDEMDTCLSNILTPYLDGRKIDAVVLGCTHYIHAAEAIRKALGGQVEIFDGAVGTVRETHRRLETEGILNPSEAEGMLVICNSSDDPDFIERSELLLEM